MSQANFTPISLYYSTTASAVPTAANLVPGELAINTNDGKLYYEDSSGVVQVLATKSTGSIGGSNTQVQFNNSGSLGGSSGLTWDGSFLTTSSIKNSALTSGRVTYAGASGLLSDSATLTYNGTTLTATTGANFCTTSGNVGIGTSSPARKLHVKGGTGLVQFESTTSACYVYVGDSTSSGIDNQGIASTGNNLLLVAGGSEKITITSAGLVGIGTSSPAVTLHASASVTNANGAGTEILRVANTRANTGTSGAAISFVTNEIESTNQYIRGQITGEYDGSSNVNGRLLFATANTSGTLTERMRLDSSGNLLVGTTSAAGKLAVYGTNISSPLLVVRDEGTPAANLVSVSANSLGTVFSVSSAGIVAMGIYGAGAATFSASGVISSVSDETWKIKDGVPTNTDAMLQKLEPGYWFYNEEKAPTFGEERQLGFYAQNVHEAIGEEAAPTPQEGKPWGYHDRSVLAITVMSLKNALNTIEELKQRIATLENK